MNVLEWITVSLGEVARRLRREWRCFRQRRALKALDRAPSRKIIIGSSGTGSPGWVSTDRETLDLLHANTWRSLLRPASLDAILAEHVWEHLGPQEAVAAATTCHAFLAPGGYLRVAVPDGLHPDPAYIESVRPGGTGGGADDHKVLYTYRTFRNVFEQVGFDVVLHEYFDERGHFHCHDWNPANGMIRRSKRFDPRNTADRLTYPSIVLDAVKSGAAGVRGR